MAGVAGRGAARRGEAWQAGRGAARRGEAGHGRAWVARPAGSVPAGLARYGHDDNKRKESAMLFPKRVAVSVVVAVAGVVGVAGVAGASSPHVVQPGDTLSELAPGRWAEVARGNGIANPDLIFVGQVIDLDATAPAPTVRHVHRRAPARQAAPVTGSGVWDRLAQCESGGNWSIATGNGYYGGLQFAPGSWRAAGGSGNPAAASREEQIRVAENLLGMQGWGAWPACSRKLGLR